MHGLDGEHLEHEHVERALHELPRAERLLLASHRRLIEDAPSYQMSRGVELSSADPRWRAVALNASLAIDTGVLRTPTSANPTGPSPSVAKRRRQKKRGTQARGA